MSDVELAAKILGGVILYFVIGVITAVVWMQFFPNDKKWAQHRFHYEPCCRGADHLLGLPVIAWPLVLGLAIPIGLIAAGVKGVLSALEFMANETKEIGKKV